MICIHTEKPNKAKNNEEHQSQRACRVNKEHLEKDTEHDEWQNEDDSGQDVKPEIGEWTCPKLWRMQSVTRKPTAPLLNLLKENLEAS